MRKTCLDCGAVSDVDPSADPHCPQCGKKYSVLERAAMTKLRAAHPRPIDDVIADRPPPTKPPSILQWMLWIGFAILVLTIAKACESPRSGTSSQAVSIGPRTMSHTTYGCRTREEMGKLSEYRIQGDTEAYQKALLTLVAVGHCDMLAAGDAVQVSDVAVFAGLVKVRKVGDLQEYWVNTEYVAN